MFELIKSNIDGISLAVRCEDRRINYMKNDGSFISDEWLIEGDAFFVDGFVRVKFCNGVQYYMKYDGIFHTEKPM